jgi:hypothetical protein
MLPSPRRTDLGGKPAVMLGTSEMATWLGVSVFTLRSFPPSKSGLTACDYACFKGTNPMTGDGNACMLLG